MREEVEEARKRERKESLGLNNQGTIVAEPTHHAEDFFWEVAAVIGRRIRRNRIEYLIRWKGCSEEDNTWEPASNLCDTASELNNVACKYAFHFVTIAQLFTGCFTHVLYSGSSDEIL